MKVDEVTAGRTAVTIAIASVAVVVVTIGALAMPAVRAKLGFVPAKTVSYPAGGTIDVPAEVYASSPYTLVLFARSTCGVCMSVKPAFAAIAAEVSKRADVRMVMVTGRGIREDEVRYAKDVGLDEARLVILEDQKLRLRIVPTLVLVDRAGTVHYASEGAPSLDEQAALLLALTSLPGSR